jgi:hypothetical protein
MHANNILVPEQFGFRQGKSTKNVAFKLTDSVFKSINQICDLAKAVDYVNH